ncbi:hypothetical protein SDC9_142458 [bioreactor metagenome]|uniref:Uncharacterized protein n=1 Tax=bioreactor metagenome TaxID=1076179 RepID=A0A645E0J2_9ZZZZ
MVKSRAAQSKRAASRFMFTPSKKQYRCAGVAQIKPFSNYYTICPYREEPFFAQIVRFSRKSAGGSAAASKKPRGNARLCPPVNHNMVCFVPAAYFARFSARRYFTIRWISSIGSGLSSGNCTVPRESLYCVSSLWNTSMPEAPG